MRIIIEMQTTNGQTAVVTPIETRADPVEGEAVFLEKLPYARRSGLDAHTVLLLDEAGNILARKCFKR